MKSVDNERRPPLEQLRVKGFLDIPAKNPHGEGTCIFRVSQRLVDRFLRYGPEHVYWDLVYVVPLVLQRPLAIFEGLKRPEHDGALCYTGIPPYRHRESRSSYERQTLEPVITKEPSPAGMLFAVFVNADYVIFNWRWEKMDDKREGHLSGTELRFEKKLWPR